MLLAAAVPQVVEAQHPGVKYRAVLELAGGPLQFTLITDAGGLKPVAWICTGPDCALATWTRDGDSLRLHLPDYDAVMVAAFRGDSLDGYYHNIGRLGPRTIPFRAAKRPDEMIRSRPRNDMVGTWDANFITDGRISPRVFQIRAAGEGMEAAVISNTGDYGRFVGRAEGDSARFSHFDGSFIYMFTVRLDGDTLRGTFNAGLRTQTPFTAVRATGLAHLTPPEAMTQADTAPFRFSFRDLDGKLVTQDDPRFRGKVVIVDLFGTWCPTCHDAAAALRSLYDRYHARGLEIVGLAYEVSGDTATDARMVRTFRDKFGLPWPLLLAGLPNSASQASTQPQLTNFTAYPTTLFLGKDGRIRRTHAGFYGPATGTAHSALVEDFAKEVDRLLSE
ncbi:MAG: TlpA family protein disulfide reductase [Gemmatimonadetes bacterium]|nr:TlpA family protein disulfide reductase [Gemmatimonadota bacterium]